MLRQGEEGDGAAGLPLLPALFQVGFEAVGGLVAVFGVFGQQAQDDVAEALRKVRGDFLRRAGRAGNVGVDEFQGVYGRERQLARAKLVKSDTQGVEVGAVIHGPVHAPGLFGGDVGQGAFQDVGAA